MKVESEFQKDLKDDLKILFPGCIVIKQNPLSLQGVPDWLVLYNDKWAMLECKRSKHEKHRPNQDYYVDLMNRMSFASFIYPENRDEVLVKLYEYFNSNKGETL